MTREEEIRQVAINHICDDTEQLLVLFEEGAKWADKTMIDKACEWLENNFVCFLQGAKRGIYSNQFVTVNEMVDNFKRTMEK